MNICKNQAIKIYEYDISEDVVKSALSSKIIACDIETTGLDWKEDKICTCQIYIPSDGTKIIKVNGGVPEYLTFLLNNKNISKVFHYAMFDLRFMCAKWNIVPENIQCTKIASKLLEPSSENKHSLKYLLEKYLNITIDKNERFSNWDTESLSENQIKYAAKDVVYLIQLLEKLKHELDKKGLLDILCQCYKHIPTRVHLEINNYPDVFTY